MEPRSPVEILSYASDAGMLKAKRSFVSLMILSFFAGAFVAFAAAGSNMAAFNLLANPDTYGLGRLVVGIVFGTALLLVVLAGGDLFTGNCLLIIPVLDRKLSPLKFAYNLLMVYLGNFLGGLLIAWMNYQSGLFDVSGGLLGGVTIEIAAGKTSLPFHSAFIMGILCNWLVCIAVWISWASKDITGKILLMSSVICLFAISAYEHSIANIYYITAGLFAAQNPEWLSMANISIEQLNSLNINNFLVSNLLPVTLGNFIGGAGFVGLLYWLALGRNGKIQD